MELRYETRDSKGKEIVKMVKVKEYPVEAIEYSCFYLMKGSIKDESDH